MNWKGSYCFPFDHLLKGIVLCSLATLLVVPAFTSGQSGVSNVPINNQPLVSFQATGGYFFWNAREVYDSMPQVTNDHNTALNKGFRYGGDLLFHLNDGFSLGATYRQLGTSHKTDPNHWNIPVTDSNNRVIIDPNTGGFLYGPRYGSIEESIELWFIGVRLTKEFELQNNFYVGISFAPGLMNYFETGNFVGYNVEYEGSNLAVDITLDGKYEFDQNWSALVQLSLFNGSIASPNYTDVQQGLVNYPLSEPQSLLNYSINAGIRFTINKNNKPPKKKSSPNNEMPDKKDQDRFQLGG